MVRPVQHRIAAREAWFNRMQRLCRNAKRRCLRHKALLAHELKLLSEDY